MIILLMVIVLVWMILPGQASDFPTQKLYHHRGHFKPDQSIRENSIEAFATSLNQGIGVELDVQLSQDEQVVVFHDANLNRLFTRVDAIKDITQAELKSLEIPTLSEVLEMFDQQQPVIIELKAHHNPKLLCEKVAHLLDDYRGEFMVESFDPRMVYWFRKHRPQFLRGQLLMSLKMYDSKILGVFLISQLYNFLTRPHFIATHWTMKYGIYGWLMRKLKGRRIVWTVLGDEIQRYKDLDGIIFEDFEADKLDLL